MFTIIKNSIAAFSGNVYAGLNLSLFLPVRVSNYRFSIFQAFLLFITALTLNFTYDYFNTLPDNQFNVYGLNYQATLYLLFLFSIFIIAAIKKSQGSALKLVIIILSITPTTFLVYVFSIWLLGVQDVIPFEQGYWGIFILYLTWHLLIIFRTLRLIFFPAYIECAGLLLIYIFLNVIPWFTLPNISLWYSITPVISKEIKSPPELDYENIFYSQNNLLWKNTARLSDQRTGVIDLYFLGFAGYAREDVFMNETQLARRLFDRRFDTKDRSLMLVNNKRTVNALPLANTHNLDSALQYLAGRMDREEDILFLFLNSHGDENNGLSINLEILDMNSLTPEILRSLLNNSSIRWRVIVVSACFSGSFLEYFNDPYSMVITASAADKASFGCGHDGNFTYFGEAFFGQGLEQEISFIEAFQIAKNEIEKKEQAEDLPSSSPQIHIGSKIMPRLELLFERLKSKTNPASGNTLVGQVNSPATKNNWAQPMIPDTDKPLEQKIEQ